MNHHLYQKNCAAERFLELRVGGGSQRMHEYVSRKKKFYYKPGCNITLQQNLPCTSLPFRLPLALTPNGPQVAASQCREEKERKRNQMHHISRLWAHWEERELLQFLIKLEDLTITRDWTFRYQIVRVFCYLKR